MSTKQQPSNLVPPELEGVRRRFERWRRTRSKKTRVPERLWQAGVAVAGSCGASRTAQILGLDYYELRKRLGDDTGARAVEGAGIGSFVELVRGVPAVDEACVVEVESREGMKLRVHLKGRPEAGWLRSLLFGREQV